MASDNNNAIQLLLSVFSIIQNKDDETYYDFYFLLSPDFRPEIKNTINILLKDHNLGEARFIDMGNSYKNKNIYIGHISIPTFYRLSLPELLKVDKCIYLDTDVVVLKDLRDLYNQIDDSFMLSGVKAAVFYWPKNELKKKAKELMIDRFDSYVNAGVMVMNLSLMRELNINRKIKTLLNHGWKNQDQDILNSACYGYIKILPPQYNSMTKYWNDNFNNYYSDRFPYLKFCYSESEWKEACEDPVIIHYADKEKPWNTMGVARFRLWWQYLKEVDKFYPCYDELYTNFINEQISKVRNDNALLKDSILELEKIKNSRSYKLAQIIAKIAKPFKSR